MAAKKKKVNSAEKEPRKGRATKEILIAKAGELSAFAGELLGYAEELGDRAVIVDGWQKFSYAAKKLKAFNAAVRYFMERE